MFKLKKLEPTINHFERQKITHFGQWFEGPLEV